MRERLARWRESLEERAQSLPRSAVSLLDRLLQAVPKAQWAGATPAWLPKSDIGSAGKANRRPPNNR
jgi:hypothetical protein